jgi:altronate hydrolase
MSRAGRGIFKRNPFTGDDPLADFPNVDGVVALTHKTGCGMTQERAAARAAPDARRLRAAREFLRRDRAGSGLRGQPDRRLMQEQRSPAACARWTSRPSAAPARPSPPVSPFVREVLADANKVRRETGAGQRTDGGAAMRRLRRLFRRLRQSGAGRASDLVVRHGGTVILSETPETYGAEHLLTRRAVSREVGEKLVALMRWWEDYTARERRDERQSLARQQGRRPDHHPGKVARRDGQGRQHQPRRRRATTPRK